MPASPSNPTFLLKNVTSWGKLSKRAVAHILGRLSREALTPTVLKETKFSVQVDLMTYALGVSKHTKFSIPPGERCFSAILKEAVQLAALVGNRLHRPLLTKDRKLAWDSIGFFALRGPAAAGHPFPVIEHLLTGKMYQAPPWVTLYNFDDWLILDNLAEDTASLANDRYTSKLSRWVANQECALVPVQGSALPGQSTPHKRPVAFSPLTGQMASMPGMSPTSAQPAAKKSRHCKHL